MKETYNPRALGIVKNTVGHIPAGRYNPDIYYAPSSEDIAAVVLLAFHLMQKEIAGHMSRWSLPVICSETYDRESLQIYTNLRDRFPVSTIRQDASYTDQELKSHSSAMGIADREVPIGCDVHTIRIFRNTLGSTFLSELFNAMDDDEDAPNDLSEDLVVEEDVFFSPLEDLSPKSEKSPVLVPEVLAAIGNEEALVLLAKRLEDPSVPPLFRQIPFILGHEIGHMKPIEKAVINNGAGKDILLLKPDFDSGEILPSSAPKFLEELIIGKFAGPYFMNEILVREFQARKKENSGPEPHYLKNTEEAKADLLGAAIIDDMNQRYGLNLYKSPSPEAFPESYTYIRKWVSDPKAVEPPDDDFFVGADYYMKDYAEWLKRMPVPS